MYAQASLLCLPEEDSDPTFFDGEATLFSDDYDLGRKLGDGGYSEVFLCTSKATGAQFAVKVIAKSRLDSSGLRALTEEVRVTRKVRAGAFESVLYGGGLELPYCRDLLPCTPSCAHIRTCRVSFLCIGQLRHPNIVQMVAFYNEEGEWNQSPVPFPSRWLAPLPPTPPHSLCPCAGCVTLSDAVIADTFFLVSELMGGGELFEQIIRRVRYRLAVVSWLCPSVSVRSSAPCPGFPDVVLHCSSVFLVCRLTTQSWKLGTSSPPSRTLWRTCMRRRLRIATSSPKTFY
jgi:serine/threonine protein kinase